jgi:hypothetical protein
MASCAEGSDCATNGATLGGPVNGNAQGGHLQASFGPVGGATHSGTLTSGHNEGFIDPTPLDPNNSNDTSTALASGHLHKDLTVSGRFDITDPNGVFGGDFQCTGRCTLPPP